MTAGDPVSDPDRVWLVLGDKLGDNAQVLALAGATGLAHRVKKLKPKAEWVLGKPRFRPGLAHLDLAASDPLEPPWPELILTIGRRPSMAALWVQERSGGSTRIVIVGRPKRWPDRFALIVAPAQFDVPPADNVLTLDLPLMRADPTALEQAAARWRPLLADLPRPLTAVFIGGQTKPYRLDAEVAGEIVRELKTIQARDGGSIFVSTSRRTLPQVTQALQVAAPSDWRLYRFGTDPAEDNPYAGLLALADRFVVTGDSISMMVEVARLAKPLAIAPLPVQPGMITRGRLALGQALSSRGALASLGSRAREMGLLGFQRDLGRIHERLVARGLAVRLGRPFATAAGPAADELARAAAAVRGLLP